MKSKLSRYVLISALSLIAGGATAMAGPRITPISAVMMTQEKDGVLVTFDHSDAKILIARDDFKKGGKYEGLPDPTADIKNLKPFLLGLANGYSDNAKFDAEKTQQYQEQLRVLTRVLEGLNIESTTLSSMSPAESNPMILSGLSDLKYMNQEAFSEAEGKWNTYSKEFVEDYKNEKLYEDAAARLAE